MKITTCWFISAFLLGYDYPRTIQSNNEKYLIRHIATSTSYHIIYIDRLQQNVYHTFTAFNKISTIYCPPSTRFLSYIDRLQLDFYHILTAFNITSTIYWPPSTRLLPYIDRLRQDFYHILITFIKISTIFWPPS